MSKIEKIINSLKPKMINDFKARVPEHTEEELEGFEKLLDYAIDYLYFDVDNEDFDSFLAASFDGYILTEYLDTIFNKKLTFMEN